MMSLRMQKNFQEIWCDNYRWIDTPGVSTGPLVHVILRNSPWPDIDNKHWRNKKAHDLLWSTQ